jgi:hypothetical protein
VQDFAFDGIDGVWLDPARRTTASGKTVHRSRNPGDWSPPARCGLRTHAKISDRHQTRPRN